MRTSRQILTFLFAALLSTALVAQADDSAAAKTAAASWLATMDAADYAATWETAAAAFKSSIAVAAWSQAAKSVRDPLGPMQSRAEKAVTMTTTLAGAPDGNYAVLQFDTTFANKAASVETLSLLLESGQWKVVGYFIK